MTTRSEATLAARPLDRRVGRELDAAIAEQLLGWKPAPVPPDCDGKNAGEVLTADGRIPEGYAFNPRGAVHRAMFVPEYHRDLGEVLILARSLGHKSAPLRGGSEAEMAAYVCQWLLTPNAELRGRPLADGPA